MKIQSIYILVSVLVLAAVAYLGMGKRNESVHAPETREEENLSQLQNMNEEGEGEAQSVNNDQVADHDSSVNSASASAKNGSNPTNKTPAKAVGNVSDIASNKTANLTPLSAKEIKSLRSLVKAMALTSNPKHTPQVLIKSLNDAGLEPIMSKNFNEDTGKMVIVRTQKTLPGERYLHAQYFEDENKAPFLQHLSFEFRPGSDSMQQAVAAIKELVPDLSKASVKPRFIEWKTKDGYSVWVQVLSKEDIAEKKKEPGNAYSYDDVNTIIVAKEQDIH